MKKFFLLIGLFLIASCNVGNTQNSAPVPSENKSETQTAQTTETQKTFSDAVGEQISADPGYAQCIATSKITCGTNFINSYAVNNSSTEICGQFADESLQIACREMVITETAKKTLDHERCNELADQSKKALCIQSVILAKGIKNSDPTVCSNYVLSDQDTDSLENLKDRCVVHIIDQLEPTEKTKGLCGLIVSNDLKASCEARIQEFIDFAKENPVNAETPVK